MILDISLFIVKGEAAQEDGTMMLQNIRNIHSMTQHHIPEDMNSQIKLSHKS